MVRQPIKISPHVLPPSARHLGSFTLRTEGMSFIISHAVAKLMTNIHAMKSKMPRSSMPSAPMSGKRLHTSTENSIIVIAMAFPPG